MTTEDAAARHLFTGWLLGTKRFIAVVSAFCLILAAETWWEFEEQLAQAQCRGLADFICGANAFAKALVSGLVTASFCLLSLWFISYFTKEVWQMIAELFLQNRFQRGRDQGIRQGAAARQKAWDGWDRRRERLPSVGKFRESSNIPGRPRPPDSPLRAKICYTTSRPQRRHTTPSPIHPRRCLLCRNRITPQLP